VPLSDEQTDRIVVESFLQNYGYPSGMLSKLTKEQLDALAHRVLAWEKEFKANLKWHQDRGYFLDEEAKGITS
jgi:hypothetical protein